MTTPLAQNVIDKHISCGGNSCLVCGSEQIEGHSLDFEGSTISQKVTCLDCDASWTNVYALHTVVNLKKVEE